jgi:hypothetical protein
MRSMHFDSDIMILKGTTNLALTVAIKSTLELAVKHLILNCVLSHGPFSHRKTSFSFLVCVVMDSRNNGSTIWKPPRMCSTSSGSCYAFSTQVIHSSTPFSVPFFPSLTWLHPHPHHYNCLHSLASADQVFWNLTPQLLQARAPPHRCCSSMH